MRKQTVPYAAMTTPHDAPQELGHPSTWPTPEQPAPVAPKKKRGVLLALVLVAIVVLASSVVGVLLAAGDDKPAGPVDPLRADESRQAEKACQGFIEKELKAPSTAKYPTPETIKDGPKYTVSGDVDSENSFSAMIRNPYRCIVTSEGGGKWTLVDLKLGKG